VHQWLQHLYNRRNEKGSGSVKGERGKRIIKQLSVPSVAMCGPFILDRLNAPLRLKGLSAPPRSVKIRYTTSACQLGCSTCSARRGSRKEGGTKQSTVKNSKY
jgi:hypothetical protein